MVLEDKLNGRFRIKIILALIADARMKLVAIYRLSRK